MSVALFVLWVPTYGASARAAALGSIELMVHATGAVSGGIQTRREFDKTHFCALLGNAGKEQTLILGFNQGQTDYLLGQSDFGLSLSITGVVGHFWDETQPSTILQVSIGNRLFVGLHAVDPGFHLNVSVDPKGGKGTFIANHLLEPSNGAVIDVDGSWRCDPGKVTIGEIPTISKKGGGQVAGIDPTLTAVSQRPSPPVSSSERQADEPQAATASPEDDSTARPPSPIEARPRRFRLYHPEPCRGSACNAWTATDVTSGQVSAAVVELRHLRIAASLLPAARAGLIELWITGQATADSRGRLVISAGRLDGVVPRRSGIAPAKAVSGR